jgi:hypothetical protein
MNKLMLFVVLAISACGGSNNNTTPPIDAATQNDAAGIQCFTGTPTSNDQLINACVDEKVITVIHKPTVLPLLNPDGTLPALP